MIYNNVNVSKEVWLSDIYIPRGQVRRLMVI